MTSSDHERDDERALDAVGAALRKAAPTAEFTPGFADRVLDRMAGRVRAESLERALVRHFGRYLAPFAVASTLAAAILNVRAATDAELTTLERLLGWERPATTPLDLYSLYVSEP